MRKDKVEEYEGRINNWLQKEAQVWEFIYKTVNKSTFLQIKNKLTTAAVWKKLASIHMDKGAMFQTKFLMQLQNA
ncbi:hypothetical protein C0991_007699, partial [Blastosporella zonata]